MITDNVHGKAKQYLEEKGFTVSQIKTPKASELIEKVKGYDAIILRSATKLREDVLKQLQDLKVIGRAGAGLDNIDLSFAKEKNIPVYNSPFAHAVSVAEHAFSLLLAITKYIPMADKTMKEGKWLKKQYKNNEVRGKTLGIIGFGHIGEEIAKRALAFEMKIVVFDVVEQCIDNAKKLGGNIAKGVDEMLPAVDYLTLHIPLNQHTRHMLHKENMKLMKKNAIIINTSRGKVINQDDLVEILQSGSIKGAALDVFKDEPINEGDPILELENVVLTPHIASSTEENQAVAALTVAEKIATFFD